MHGNNLEDPGTDHLGSLALSIFWSSLAIKYHKAVKLTVLVHFKKLKLLFTVVFQISELIKNLNIHFIWEYP